MPNTWTEDETEKLVALYGQYQCLWNPFYPEFVDRSSRYKAYGEIKNLMNIPGLTICDCIEEIANVRKKYCYELSKVTAAIFYDKSYTPRVKWFKRMHMLLFPYTSTSRFANYFRERCNRERKYNDIGIQDDSLRNQKSFRRTKDEPICSNNTCGTYGPQESVDPAPKSPPCTFASCGTVQMTDVGTEISSCGARENGTQTNGPHDCSTRLRDISVGAHSGRRIENSFDIFGKSVAFQLRIIDTQTAAELQKEIQGLITKTRLKTLLSTKPVNRTSTQFCSDCCSDCNDCKIMCTNKNCNCGLTLKECLLLTKFKENQSYKFCYK